MKKKFLTLALTASMVLGSAFSAFAADVDTSKVYEGGQLIDGTTAWNTADGDNYLISDTPVTVAFTNDPFKRANVAAVENWDNFVIETLASDTVKGITMRADAFSWTYGEATEEPTAVAETSWGEDWTTFQDMCKANTNVTITATKTDANTVTFDIAFGTAATEKYTVTYPSGVPSDLRFHVGADGGAITVNSVTYATEDESAAETGSTTVSSPDGSDPEADTTTVSSPDGSDPEADTTTENNQGTGEENTSAPAAEDEAGVVSAEVVAEIAKSAVVEGAPEGAKLEVNAIAADSEEYSLAKKFVTDELKAKAWAVLDLKLVDAENAVIQPDGKVKITLPVFENIKDAKYVAVYRLDDSKFTHLSTSEVKDGKFTFETDHFSTYLFASVDNPATDSTVDGSETTTGDTAPIAGMMVAALAAVGAVVLVSAKKKNA